MPQHDPSALMEFQVAGRSNEELAALLAAPAAPERRAPALQIVGAVVPAAHKPRIGAALTVTITDDARRWLKQLDSDKDAALRAIDLRYRGREREPAVATAKAEERRRVVTRFAVDIDTIENCAALAAAQAVEQEDASLLERLRALYPKGENDE